MEKTTQSLAKVLKFGGTSVGTSQRLGLVSDIILQSQKQANQPIAACVSAMSGTTKKDGTTSRLLRTLDAALEQNPSSIEEEIRQLQAFHKDIIAQSIQDEAEKQALTFFLEEEMKSLTYFLKALMEIEEISSRSRDRVISLGEILSARILTSVVNDKAGKKIAKFINLNQLVPDKNNQETDTAFYQNLENTLGVLLKNESSQFPILVLTGYIGKIPGGIIEKIGRGYTDYTASLAAAGTDASFLEIWKEVDGIFSADPRKVNNAQVVPHISYREAAELTYFGTEAIHPLTMGPCIRKNIPIRVKNVLNTASEGTLVDKTESPSQHGIGKAVTQKSDIAIISMESDRMNEAPGFIYQMGNIFFKEGISIDLMATSEVSISTTVHNVDSQKLASLAQKLEKIGTVSIMEGLTSISIIGHGMQKHIGVAGKVFAAMGQNNINIILISQGASELSISFVVKSEDASRALNTLHQELLHS